MSLSRGKPLARSSGLGLLHSSQFTVHGALSARHTTAGPEATIRGRRNPLQLYRLGGTCRFEHVAAGHGRSGLLAWQRERTAAAPAWQRRSASAQLSSENHGSRPAASSEGAAPCQRPALGPSKAPRVAVSHKQGYLY